MSGARVIRLAGGSRKPPGAPASGCASSTYLLRADAHHQLPPPGLATPVEGLSAPSCFHSGPKPMLVLPLAIPGLVGRHHG